MAVWIPRRNVKIIEHPPPLYELFRDDHLSWKLPQKFGNHMACIEYIASYDEDEID